MTILSYQSIIKRCTEYAPALIEPFVERGTSNGRTFGLSACGYDVRLDQDIWLWPFWGRLGSIQEYIDMPGDLCAEVKDKSTNARMFILVQNTIIEPGWRGYLTVELTRFLPWPVKLKRGTPIAQIVFKKLDEPTWRPYQGKYQDQDSGPQAARLNNQR